ncbi:MAG: ABC transporter ATP-binding protein [Candidatus Eremiobacteraeota bacterium]|nr:ABC transporter ATP-binding protein [Candidatus Eremiobacteraeota bacterium]MCW5869741.1 ABC transporter ATP-binding protein [Candidatus Eremiobacteraeota bacterium]
MNYQLSESQPVPATVSLRRLWPLLRPQRVLLGSGLVALVSNTVLALSAPALTGYAIDHYVTGQDLPGLARSCVLLLVLYGLAGVAVYFQSVWTGTVGQQLLFQLRKQLFEKLQELPLGFFQVNQSGDLISRLNNDTDKINMFFSQALMQFLGGLITMLGSACFLLGLNPRLGLVALAPALFLLILTRLLAPFTRGRNAESLQSLGNLSAESSDSLENFKVVVAFDRQDYFRQRFERANQANYRSALRAGIANQLFVPTYALCSNLAQLVVLLYGLEQVARGELTVGMLIGYLVYVIRFYDPVRSMASLWATFQTAMAGWDRIHAILQLESSLKVIPDTQPVPANSPRLEMRGVHFGYLPEREILSQVEMRLEAGKSYALVGPTGGGKTTTASLMARLYDPGQGQVLLDGRDLRTYPAAQRSRKIGFILQEPFLQAGTLRQNFQYANADYRDELIPEMRMETLLENFSQGLDTQVEGLSLGQKQIVAFMRAVLRRPELLILDEATANIDTVTENALASILENLPETTTRVIIAHRLNTIAKADQIYFINQGRVQLAGSMAEAVQMLREGGRSS